MKKTTKHPLTFFREANEKRQATVKNSLRKAQDGGITEKWIKTTPPIGPLTETQADLAKLKESINDPMSGDRGPRITTPQQDMSNSVQNPMDYKRALRNQAYTNALNTEMLKQITNRQKKGGPVKKMKKGGTAKETYSIQKGNWSFSKNGKIKTAKSKN